MNFALLRNNSALSLLALEKLATAYRIHHFDKRPLPQIAARQASLIQEMISFCPEPITNLIVGVEDADLLIKHVAILKHHNILKSYQQCKKILSKEICLKNYSWDAYIINNDNNTHQLFCAAYPLEKIIFLQEILNTINIQIRALEPSICALMRAKTRFGDSELSQNIQCHQTYWLKTEKEQLLTSIGLAIKDEAV